MYLISKLNIYTFVYYLNSWAKFFKDKYKWKNRSHKRDVIDRFFADNLDSSQMFNVNASILVKVQLKKNHVINVLR